MATILGNGNITFGDNTAQSTAPRTAAKLMNCDDQNTAYRHAFAIMSDGTVMGWGYDQTYTLGTGRTGIDRQLPVQVGFPPSFPGASEVHTQHNLASCCIDVNGQLWTWGRNDYGSCGIGSTANVKSPTNVSLIVNNSIYGKTVVQVAYPCGIQDVPFILVRCSDGTVHACGYNGYGQCGNGNTTDQYYFVRCGTLTGVTHIACGRQQYTACAAVVSGSMYVWGYNGDYQLGTGNNVSSSTPSLRNNGSLAGKTVTKVGASYRTLYALCSDNTLHGMGNQADGEFGVGTTTNYTTPVQCNTNVASFMSASYDGPIVSIIKTDNTVWWAGHANGMTPLVVTATDAYGNPTAYGNSNTRLWYQVTGWSGTPQKVIHTGTGGYKTLYILTTAGYVYTIGYNNLGQGGTGDDSSPYLTTNAQLVKCDLASDISCYGDGYDTCLMILTRKGVVKVSGTHANWANGSGVYDSINVPAPLNL